MIIFMLMLLWWEGQAGGSWESCTTEMHFRRKKNLRKEKGMAIFSYLFMNLKSLSSKSSINLNSQTSCANFFFFFIRRYNPWWVLACFMISFHNLLSLHFSLLFLTFVFFKSSSTWSSHLILGLPTGLDEHGSHSVNFLTVLVVSILITCAAQHNICYFINLTIFFFLN